MDLHSGACFWPLVNGLGLVVPPLDRDVTCDVAVIGAGITGALLADAMTRAGLSVAALDRRDVGEGSTAASTALLMYDIDTPLHRLRERIGRRRGAGVRDRGGVDPGALAAVRGVGGRMRGAGLDLLRAGR